MPMNNLLWMLMGMWNFSGIKDKLLQLWIPPETLQNVDFNNVQSMNQLAQKIMPWILANNKQLAEQVKAISAMLWQEKQKEISDVIDMG